MTTSPPTGNIEERKSDPVSINRMHDFEYYHVIELSPGVMTPGIETFLPIQAPVHEELRGLNLNGKRVLDIGCRDGLFCFDAERLGASEIIGIDNDLSPAATEFLIPWFKSKTKMLEKNLYDLEVSGEEQFDVIIFAGVLYHLRLPFLGLRKIANALKPSGKVIIETGLLLSNSRHPLMYCPRPEDSPYDPTSVTFFNHLALVASLETLGFTQIRCKNILVSTSPLKSYRGWDAFLAGPDAGIATSSDIIVGRGTYTCELRADLERTADGALRSYWYGEHRLNSSKSLGQSFLEAYRPKEGKG